MQIGKDTVVTLTYQLTTLSGELLEEATLESPAAYLHGGYDGIFPKVEESLEGKAAGDELDVVLEPNDAFGEYDAELVRVEPAHLFPEEVQVGMQLEGASEEGEHALLYTVTDVAEGQVVVDGNHPLAGQSLRLQCQVREVRVALPVEVEHGHVHGEHEHPH
ncbi:MAG: peptidylprolyl isomerase [Hydrogenophilales bacterium CG17_big_fil_post_rev_8_21_14_2_50_63_12]|nr:MAG: peptidylprolyl isomerase [Hydrogenophilales bacterium CG17_big_fil_post_rev_8_21_14_2_50_63_12]PIX97889.1 MAG: peptidylprolyl isomerase [Hydrogenophilales bacterium CG_4_10_14_3_um_filter_63_21]PJB02290.1 MAG: peptidylprolyl isomerase [Hydrogenophilales bacterium CG_4_9_14_3_um_filter_63_34]